MMSVLGLRYGLEEALHKLALESERVKREYVNSMQSICPTVWILRNIRSGICSDLLVLGQNGVDMVSCGILAIYTSEKNAKHQLCMIPEKMLYVVEELKEEARPIDWLNIDNAIFGPSKRILRGI